MTNPKPVEPQPSASHPKPPVSDLRSSHPKPWEVKPGDQWPTPSPSESQLSASQPQEAPEESIVKLETTALESDVISIMGTLTANACENIVVIGMSDDGRVFSLRRQSPNGTNPYTLIGALEAFKQVIIENELGQTPIPAKKD